MSLFPSVMCHCCRFIFVQRKHYYTFSSRIRLCFLPCEHGLDFDISLLCDNLINQSSPSTNRVFTKDNSVAKFLRGISTEKAAESVSI